MQLNIDNGRFRKLHIKNEPRYSFPSIEFLLHIKIRHYIWCENETRLQKMYLSSYT